MPKFSSRKLRRKAARESSSHELSEKAFAQLMGRHLEKIREEQKPLEGMPIEGASEDVLSRLFKADAGLLFLQQRIEGVSGREVLEQARLSLVVAMRLLSVARGLSDPRLREAASHLPSDLKPGEEEERKRLFSAQKSFLNVAIGNDEGGFPRTLGEEASQIIQAFSTVLTRGREGLPKELTSEHASLWALQLFSGWLAQQEALSEATPQLVGPLATALMRRTPPRNAEGQRRLELAIPDAVRAAARKMEQAPLGPTSEEAVRQALIVFFQACGATPQEAGNWFRP